MTHTKQLEINYFENIFSFQFQCGADYVKVKQEVPIGMPPVEPYTRCVSVDGDADRIIYYFTDDDGKCKLLDGDRIATLIAG